MPRKIFVFGHKNPDAASVVTAIACAELLRLQGDGWPHVPEGTGRPNSTSRGTVVEGWDELAARLGQG
jgi:inorganic pyrophosphatase/exopolyphosphatase